MTEDQTRFVIRFVREDVKVFKEKKKEWIAFPQKLSSVSPKANKVNIRSRMFFISGKIA